MTTVSAVKRCTKCGKDVTHDRRMKDGKGNYWCADCGSADASTHGSGLIAPCPKCGTPTHAAQLVRKNGIYVCEGCATGAGRKGKGAGKVLSDEDVAKRKKVILGVSLIVLGAAAYAGMNFLM